MISCRRQRALPWLSRNATCLMHALQEALAMQDFHGKLSSLKGWSWSLESTWPGAALLF